MKWLTLVSNTSDATVPKLFSTSYGEDEDEIPMNWADRTNAEFQKAGARGISLLFASGDSGAAGDNGCKGKNNNIFARRDFLQNTFFFQIECPALPQLRPGCSFLQSALQFL